MEFKKLSDVKAITEPTESANVLIEENGIIKKVPKDEVGGVKVSNAAEVGQAIVVKAVDENGKPTEWECAELSSGGGGNVLVVPFTIVGSNYSTTANHQEVIDAIRSGVSVFGVQDTSGDSIRTGYIATYCQYNSMDEWWEIGFTRVSERKIDSLIWYSNGTINSQTWTITTG